MRTSKEIMVQLQKEHDNVTKLYAQINAYEQNINCLKTELSAVYKEETKYFIDKWLKEKFGIENQKEARKKSIFIVFDKSGNFIKTVTTGSGEEFRYVSSIEDNNTLEYWLRRNKLYAHRASSFCDRNREWYSKTFKEQLETLCWEFDKNGKLKKTQW